jgi:hypothetical protein
MKLFEGDRANARVRKACACTHHIYINFFAEVFTPYVILPAVWTAFHLLTAELFGTLEMTSNGAFDTELG